MDYTIDIESNTLLDKDSIDYTSSPYKLKDTFHMHCIVAEEHGTGKLIAFYDEETYILDGRPYQERDDKYIYELMDYEPLVYEHRQLKEFPLFVQNNEGRVIGHNFIDFDILALKLWFSLDYSIKYHTWGASKWEVVDTMVVSKTLNPDRYGGHSLDNLGKRVGLNKIQFRKHVPSGDRFKTFAADMLYYCIRDVQVNTKVHNYLEEEAQGWAWEGPIRMEHRVRDIITRGSHRGFLFDKGLAERNITELDALMEERRARVAPVLPPKQATKKFMSSVTPPAKQTKADGKFSANMLKFIDRVEGKLIKIDDTGEDEKDHTLFAFGEEWSLPLPDKEPLLTTEVAKIDDTTHIKNWLCGMGWQPTEYKEKDLTYRQVKGVGKVKRTREEYEKAVNTYVLQTLDPLCNFKEDRLEFLKVTGSSLEKHLLSKDVSKSVKVYTNPSLTVGLEKNMCPNLEVIAGRFEYAKDIVEYLTYKHRRNSILGGGLEYNEDNEEEYDKGYLSYVREDGRIATPADSCGASTSRFKHRVVTNVPRPSSLFGGQMRALFGVEKEHYQVGYDFSSLEARIEGHYCWKWEKEPKTYCLSLPRKKPHDVHTLMAKAISEVLSQEFTRDPAKSVKYCLTYGGSALKVAKTIGAPANIGQIVSDAFWEAADPLKTLKDKLKVYWETTGGRKFVLGIDGRKVPTRSAHAILNSLFQSGGVICAKQTMIYHEDLLEEAGLLVDFFKEDFRHKTYMQQLIAYHDEAQLEVTKSEVIFKIFRHDGTEDAIKKSKEDATLAKEEAEQGGEFWSTVTEGNQCHYIAYCKGADLIKKAVDLTSEKFGLKVPLAVEYMIGRNWEECH